MRQPLLASIILPFIAFPPLSAGQKPWKDSTVHEILLPTAAPPLEPEDDYQCVFSNVSQWFEPPKPTGDLMDAMFDYGDELISACVDAGDDLEVDECWPNKDQWCDFTTEAPASVTSDLEEWGSLATSWWAAQSSDALSAASECPQNWFDAMIEMAPNRQWLNLTVAWAACDEDYKEPDTTTTSADSEGISAAPGSTKTSKKVAATDLSGRAATYRADDAWKVAGGGVAAAVANLAL